MCVFMFQDKHLLILNMLAGREKKNQCNSIANLIPHNHQLVVKLEEISTPDHWSMPSANWILLSVLQLAASTFIFFNRCNRGRQTLGQKLSRFSPMLNHSQAAWMKMMKDVYLQVFLLFMVLCKQNPFKILYKVCFFKSLGSIADSNSSLVISFWQMTTLSYWELKAYFSMECSGFPHFSHLCYSLMLCAR